MQETQFDSWVGKIPWRRDRLPTPVLLGFPCGSDGKECTGSAGDLGLILGQEDPLEEGMAALPSIPAWRIPRDRGAWRATVHGVADSARTEAKPSTAQPCPPTLGETADSLRTRRSALPEKQKH